VKEFRQIGVDFASGHCPDQEAYAAKMLARVSRTFALNINVLPPSPKRTLTLAYLFCRMADTVEDDPELSPPRKHELLQLFSKIFREEPDWKSRSAEFVAALPEAWKQSEDWNHILCIFCDWPLELYFSLSDELRKSIASTVQEMSLGMGDFGLRSLQKPGEWFSIRDLEELDEYCYYVAGIVGLMISQLFFHHSSLISARRFEKMNQLAVSFGLGLQITNILKDVQEDARRNVCFLPESLAREEGCSTRDFFKDRQDEGVRVMTRLVQKAWDHLEDAFAYTLLIPRLESRMRLFCLWPLFMAAENLVAIGDGKSSFGDGPKIKITRSEVKKIIRNTSLICSSNVLLKVYFASYRRRLRRKLEKS